MNVRRGFTLIELLVVIAIVAILAAILFPVFARARENARKANCQSNLKQVATAMLAYVQDYDECFLSGRYPGTCLFGHSHQDAAPNAINDYYGWANHLQPYVKNTRVFFCPSTQPTTCTSGSEAARITDAYGYNYDGCCGRSQATVQYPSDQMMFMDMQNSFVIPSTPTYTNCMNGMGNGLTRHSDGANVAFVDGHVKWYAANKIRGMIPQTAGTYCTFLNITITTD